MATGVQTILANQNASVDVTTETYTTEQRGAWSLDVIVLDTCSKDLNITMEVSNTPEIENSWACFKVIKENINQTLGSTFMYKELPYDYIRFVIQGGTSGRYKVVFNER
jgi:hypothetical protein